MEGQAVSSTLNVPSISSTRLPVSIIILAALFTAVIGFVGGYLFRQAQPGYSRIVTTVQNSPEVPQNAQINPSLGHKPVCPSHPENQGKTAKDIEVRCHSHVIVDNQGKPRKASTANGYSPAQFRGAYGVTGVSSATGSALPIIAIVDAYDNPTVLSDLNTYSAKYGIPQLPECTAAIALSPVPCFQKIDQRGGTTYPVVDSSWLFEITLDIQVAHGMCENCKILLVEADTNSYDNLMSSIDQARTLGAKVISNSWGSGEFSGETALDSHFTYPGIAFLFSSGDSGYGTFFPAASNLVTSVGGTTLYVNTDNSYNSETAWSKGGSGCSFYESKPTWQKDTLCARRTIADVSADADPFTGAAIYLQGGWYRIGGTSLSAPIVAGIYALSGGTQTQRNSVPYSAASTNFHDVNRGSNGSCGTTYLCTAKTGYDGPTGLGTPKGKGGF